MDVLMVMVVVVVMRHGRRGAQSFFEINEG